ncbi:MAG: RagB/SusD family nutrient uptake outer membrane protein [Saprospiraceae bacterium]|nr:RagB/SusD family nutrient uptake outer membrane protein [Saprospiraceae bacterium]
MKLIYNIRYKTFLAVLSLVLATGCKDDFLVEKSVSTLTTDVYYQTEAGFEDLVKSCYPLLRNIHQSRSLVLHGTDIFSASGGWSSPLKTNGASIDLYDVGFNASLPDIQTLWTLLYKEVSRANTAISVSENITSMAAALKNTRVSEAKFLRSLAFFYLVQQWGDVPMPLKETTAATKEAIRTPSATIYTQIITDLLDCESKLPATASDYGRITKGAAQFLLSRVYLTRGWNFKNTLGGSNADFDQAVVYADKVIDAYPMIANYKDLWPKHSENPLTQYKGTQNDKNSEVVFAVQYSPTVLTNKTDAAFSADAAGGNDLHSLFGGNGEGYPGSKGRTTDYNRHLGKIIATPALYRLFDPQLDSRYDHNFVEAGYALSPVKDLRPIPTNSSLKVNLAMGDTTCYFRPWNNPATSLDDRGIDVGGKRNYAVVNVDELGGAYFMQSGYGPGENPMMWKFWEPNIPYGDAGGTFDEPIFRSAEAYLIAAEAIVKGAKNGKLGGADVYYNKVLDRALGANKSKDPKCAALPGDVKSLAAASYRATPANITVDMILDERAREFMGEYSRWFDLKRTGKLIERVKAYNPWYVKGGAIADKHYLRPLPQSEIDLSFPSLSQNEGY